MQILMKLFLTVLSLLLLSATGFTQSYYTVSGKVLSQETSQPLQGASVFAQNTTIGTATDADGNFKLYLPNGGYDLVVTFTGHNTESKRVSSGEADNTNLQFQLKQKEKELADVSIVASSEVKDGWQKYGSFFLDEFIGKTANSKSCTLRNPEVLKFFFSKRKNRLKVTAAEPLLIENNALGYTIHYTLDSFTHEYTTEVSLYTGYPLFEEMPVADSLQKLKWQEARQLAYRGSVLHFMRSVYGRRLKEEGFEIQFIVKSDDRETAVSLKDPYGALNFKRDDSLQVAEILPNQLNTGIIYTKEKPAEGFISDNPGEPSAFQFSVLTFLPGQSIIIERNGYYYEQNELATSGYWTWDKMADLLPYDYVYSN
jgi:hypothetical protein